MPNTQPTQNSLNTDLPIEVEFGGTGQITHTQNGILIGNAGDALLNTDELTDGQLLIGSTGNPPVEATLTGGFGVTINNQPGEITITSDGQNPWEVITTATHQMEAGPSYLANNNAARVVFTLPTTMPVGQSFTITAMDAEGWQIAQNAGQQIRFGNQTTTEGETGLLESRRVGDSVTIVTSAEDNRFIVIASIGNITIS